IRTISRFECWKSPMKPMERQPVGQAVPDGIDSNQPRRVPASTKRVKPNPTYCSDYQHVSGRAKTARLLGTPTRERGKSLTGVLRHTDLQTEVDRQASLANASGY